MNYTLGVDVSGYQNPDNMNYKDLYQHGFRFVVVKLGQYLTEEHVFHAREAGMRIGGYWWNDPLDDPAWQARQILTSIKTLNLEFAALDMEQYWSNWDKWYQAVNNMLPWAKIPKFTMKQIDNNAHQVIQLVSAEIKIPWLLYSADWFIEGYALSVNDWLANYKTWCAHYVESGRHVTWEDLAAMPGSHPLPNLQKVTPIIWQTGEFIFPGRADWNKYDVDLFVGNQMALNAWLHNQEPITPRFQPYWVKSIAEPTLRIHNLPSLTSPVIGRLYPDSPAALILEETKDAEGYTWGRFMMGWIRLDWTKRI